MNSPANILIPFLTVLFLIPATRVNSQDIVITRIMPPAANQLSAADLWQVELTNLSSSPLEVYMIGTVELEGSGLIIEARSAVFPIMPGLNRLTGMEVQPVRVSYVSSRYRDAVFRTGNFPAGNYTLCATAHDAGSGRELGRDCLFQVVQPFSPPQLVSPVNDMVVQQPYPVFTWTPPAPMPSDGRVQYRIKIVKLLRSQPPDAALQVNLSWFEDANVLQTTLPYPVEGRPFEVGTYAWFVEAVEPGTGVIHARSEPGVFRWEPVYLPEIPDLIATISPHGIPSDLFEAIMRPCLGNPETTIRRDIIESQNN